MKHHYPGHACVGCRLVTALKTCCLLALYLPLHILGSLAIRGWIKDRVGPRSRAFISWLLEEPDGALQTWSEVWEDA